MSTEKNKELRNIVNLAISLILLWLYIPALVAYLFSSRHTYIIYDLDRIKNRINYQIPYWLLLVYFLHIDRYFRSLFYFRVGPVWSFFIRWIRPGDRYFVLSNTMQIGYGCKVTHPFSTILNADIIGDNFSCLQSTTVGGKNGKRPVIGNNVILGANVTILGGVRIGNNVFVGAGSVVVKDIPSNCVVAGNPATIIKDMNT